MEKVEYEAGDVVEIKRVEYPLNTNRCALDNRYNGGFGTINCVLWDKVNCCPRYTLVNVVGRDGADLPATKIWAGEIVRRVEDYVDKAGNVFGGFLSPVVADGVMRNFGTGATRNGDADKFDFEGFLSPIVLQRYAEYLHKHRVQADGKLRDSDNWQKLFGDDHLDVCMKSALRHLMAVWLLHRGFPAKDEKGEPVELEDSVCGALFNLQAYLYKLLKD